MHKWVKVWEAKSDRLTGTDTMTSLLVTDRCSEQTCRDGRLSCLLLSIHLHESSTFPLPSSPQISEVVSSIKCVGRPVPPFGLQFIRAGHVLGVGVGLLSMVSIRARSTGLIQSQSESSDYDIEELKRIERHFDGIPSATYVGGVKSSTRWVRQAVIWLGEFTWCWCARGDEVAVAGVHQLMELVQCMLSERKDYWAFLDPG